MGTKLNSRSVAIMCLFLVFQGIIAAAPTLELTTENWKEKLRDKTVLVYMSLGCDIGSYASKMFGEAMEELEGVYIATFDVNSAYPMMQGKPYDLGTIALIKNGVVLESSDETYKDFEYLTGYNNQQIWVYKALTNNNIRFTMPKPENIRLSPKMDNGTVELEKGINAIYRFDNGVEDETGKRGKFEVTGVAKIVNGAFYCDGTYDTNTGGEYYATESYPPKVFNNGFAVQANIKVNKSEEQRKFVLTFGYRAINFEMNKDKLLLCTSLYGQVSNDEYIYADDFYPLTEVPFDLDVWNNIIISTDVQSGTMYLMINGKRYDDIHLSKRFIQFFNSYGTGNIGVSMHHYGWGGVLNGYADDIVVYERKINVSEMTALYNKYNKSGGKVNIVNNTNINNNNVTSSPWKGEWTGDWNNITFAMHINEFKNVVSGTYDYKSGSIEANTRIENGISIMEGNWNQVNNSGWFKFTMNADGKSFKGEWGIGDTNKVLGEWNGNRK